MAAMIGKGKSWLWWLAGCLCALLLGPRAGGADAGPAPVYGMPVPPPDKQPLNNAEQQQKAEGLVNELMTPGPAPEPPAPVKAEIDKLIQDFASEDAKVRDAASTGVVKQGVPALGALRAALASKDAEVVERAKAAIVAIETASKAPKVEELKKLGNVGQSLVQQRWNQANRVANEADKAAADAEKAGDAAATAKAKAEAKTAREQAATLAGLLNKIRPATPAFRYGVMMRQ